MDKQALVSIIIPCYNQAPYIKDAIDCVRAQSYPNWECIIVDDGSTDNSLSLAQALTADDARFQVFHKENEGVCLTRRYAIDHSQGEYILPLDGDDKIAPDYLERAVPVLAEHPDISIVYGKAEKFGCEKGLWNLPPFDMETMLVCNCIFNSCLYRRSDYDRTPGYNPNMHEGLEDWDFILSLLELSPKVYCLDSVVCYYRIVKKSRNTSFKGLGKGDIDYRTRKQLWENHRLLYSQYYPNPQRSNYFYALQGSKEYRLGKLLLAPWRKLQAWFKR